MLSFCLHYLHNYDRKGRKIYILNWDNNSRLAFQNVRILVHGEQKLPFKNLTSLRSGRIMMLGDCQFTRSTHFQKTEQGNRMPSIVLIFMQLSGLNIFYMKTDLQMTAEDTALYYIKKKNTTTISRTFSFTFPCR